MKRSERTQAVTRWVDDWFEQHRGEIDVGETSLGIDLIPDEVEKALYSKVLLIAMSLAEGAELRVAGQRIRINFESES